MELPAADKQALVERYSQRFIQFGHDPRTLGWDKGKQLLRFGVLTSQMNLRGRRILDIGCGFGDLNQWLASQYGTEYEYHGVDLVPALVDKGRELFGAPHVRFTCGDFLDDQFTGCYDFAVASGIFNFKLDHGSNYEFISAVMRKAHTLCTEGFAFDFLSDQVDFEHPHTFHSNPAQVLTMASQLSRNVVLRSDYMPFEFSLFVNKDDSFDKNDTIFTRFKKQATVSWPL